MENQKKKEEIINLNQVFQNRIKLLNQQQQQPYIFYLSVI
jgi:hypothetical protein